MEKQFEQVEKKFHLLKEEFDSKKISDREFKDRLKKLRFKDEKGRCWTLGAQSGKWYYFDGSDWIESKPPSFQDKKAICIYCGFENDLENEACVHCGGRLDEEGVSCPECGTRLKDESQDCPFCSHKEKLKERMEEKVQDPEEMERGLVYVFRSIHLLSSLLFWGVLGAIIGLVLGAFIGVSRYYSDSIQFLPDFMLSVHGKLLGGVVFGLIGGVLGFAILALAGFILAMIINIILYFVGGIKIRLTSSL